MAGGEEQVELAVVVASFREPELLEACLVAIEKARERAPVGPVPVFVARAGSGKDVADLLRERPWAVLVPVSERPDVPRLRGAGMRAASARWIAVTEDHCLVCPDWLDALFRAAASGAQVVGGGMGNARAGALNWGAFYSEYGFFSSARPPASGPSLVTGANVCYGPEVSDRVARWASAGDWEDLIHGRLASEGVEFVFAPAAEARQNAAYSFVDFCVDRYEHGRDYARARLAANPASSRAFRLMTVPFLPPLLLLRVGRAAARSNRGAFLAALPFTLAFLSAWSVGEGIGYLTGGQR